MAEHFELVGVAESWEGPVLAKSMLTRVFVQTPTIDDPPIV
jgi:hypothetical protein